MDTGIVLGVVWDVWLLAFWSLALGACIYQATHTRAVYAVAGWGLAALISGYCVWLAYEGMMTI